MNASNKASQEIPFQGLPGAESQDRSLIESLTTKYQKLGKTYQPRTRHKNSEGAALYTNRLFLETSPYLAQHAHNPVNWYPWGDEAFEIAKELNRPLLVSIGYSTCHWCHVMEEESFEDLEIAEFLNRNFVCIKVDREERPDVDAVYMAAVQAMTGSGGWPLNVTVTPERKPFWGGTYFPARNGDRGALYGFLTIANRIAQVYKNAPQDIQRSCDQLTAAIEQHLNPQAGTSLPQVSLLDAAAKMYKGAYDSRFGGIQGAPKFPSSLPNGFLLRHYMRTGKQDLLDMVTHSLKKMAAGGMYDQVGGGFHRYSTDEEWLVPHFEKMLYDNALLAVAYIEGYQITKDEGFKDIATDILEYVLREMTADSGAFYSATDADSLNDKGEQEEGYYFTWTPAELKSVLDDKQFELVANVWGATESGNFEGRNIFFLNKEITDSAGELGITPGELKQQLRTIGKILYKERNKRPLPLRDEKIIASWNGLMISAFAIIGGILNEEKYVNAAAKAAEFINHSMTLKGRLFRSFKDGELKYKAFLSDYANYIAACLDLLQVTQDEKWLGLAQTHDQTLQEFFEDSARGGFYMTGNDQETLIAREKPVSDGALPSGNSICVRNLQRLYNLTLNVAYKKRFEKALSCFLGGESGGSAGYSELLAAFELSLAKPVEIVIATANSPDEGVPFLKAIKQYFLPQVEVLVICQQDPRPTLMENIPYLYSHQVLEGKTTAYICREGSCQMPTTDLVSFNKQLQDLAQIPSQKAG